MKPLVSVIVASYNHAPFVGKAIESVLNQTYQNFELLIGDDASPDNSVEIIKKYASIDKRITLQPFTTNRQTHIRNYFLKRAKGKYIAILNSDDEYYSEKLEKQVDLLENSPEYGVIFTKTEHVDEQGNHIGFAHENIEHHNKSRLEWIKTVLNNGMLFVLSSSLYRKDLANQVGNYNELLGLAPALDMWLKFLINGANLYILDEVLTKMRIMDNGKNLSSSNPANNNRGLIEMSYILENLKDPELLTILYQIYPELGENWQSKPHNVQLYELSKYCVDNLWQPHHLFGINTMYSLLSNSQIRQELEAYYNRTLFGEFLKYTGKVRVVS